MKKEMEGEKKLVRRRRRMPEDTPKKIRRVKKEESLALETSTGVKQKRNIRQVDFAKQDNKLNNDFTNIKDNHIDENRERNINKERINKERLQSKPYDADLRRHDRKKQQRNKTISIVILCAEVLVFCGVLYGLIHFSLKLKNGDFQVEGADVEQTAATAEGAEDGASAGSVNVDNEKFSLTCTKVQLTTDVEGNPAALIYFTFVNKTDVPLSLGEVFPPKVVQDGIDCETFAALETPPDELYNKDIQIQDGASIEACYSVKLQNTTSELTLTIHDNYETFTDIGSTVIPLS